MNLTVALMNVFLIIFIASCMLRRVNCLKCYECKGPDDGRPYPQEMCERESTIITCLNHSLCGRYLHRIKSGALVNEVEARSCVVDCKSIENSCRAIILAGGNCTHSCCDKDLCNGGKSAAVKGSQGSLLVTAMAPAIVYLSTLKEEG